MSFSCWTVLGTDKQYLGSCLSANELVNQLLTVFFLMKCNFFFPLLESRIASKDKCTVQLNWKLKENKLST